MEKVKAHFDFARILNAHVAFLTTSSLVMSEAKKVVRVGLCGELQLGGLSLVCSFGCCARKQDRKGDEVQECRVY
eukprot:COSAG06_NODE_11313_length_1529_cov_93.725175_2_plen_75_part_00